MYFIHYSHGRLPKNTPGDEIKTKKHQGCREPLGYRLRFGRLDDNRMRVYGGSLPTRLDSSNGTL